jgi:hypothetical protein
VSGSEFRVGHRGEPPKAAATESLFGRTQEPAPDPDPSWTARTWDGDSWHPIDATELDRPIFSVNDVVEMLEQAATSHLGLA